VAAPGLDVRDLVLVINYDVPNHHEDYVHMWVLLLLHRQRQRPTAVGLLKYGCTGLCSCVLTSVAARGLDVRDLVLVINYDVPNHHDDYVHR
jgi:superfamily II DNA/RNA helicase